MITEGVASNSLAVRDWTEGVVPQEQLGITELYAALEAMGSAVAAGDLSRTESLLTSQAVSLNAIYVTLARRSHGAQYVENFERYLRLGLRAQAQCRATIETLALMKNPPIFARQANIAQGPQQVNNGVVNNGSARAGLPEPTPNRLLEANGPRLDERTASTAVGSHPAVEAVAEIDGSANTRGKEPSIPERVARRRTAARPSVPQGPQRRARGAA
jgi:hypothetical protein